MVRAMFRVRGGDREPVRRGDADVPLDVVAGPGWVGRQPFRWAGVSLRLVGVPFDGSATRVRCRWRTRSPVLGPAGGTHVICLRERVQVVDLNGGGVRALLNGMKVPVYGSCKVPDTTTQPEPSANTTAVS